MTWRWSSPKLTITSSSRRPTSQASTRPEQPGNAGGRPWNSSTTLLTLSLKWSVGQSTRKTPSTRISIRSATRSTSARICELKRIVRPRALDEVDHRHQEIAACDRVEAERWVVEDEQVGVRAIARARATLARWPFDSRRSFARKGIS